MDLNHTKVQQAISECDCPCHKGAKISEYIECCQFIGLMLSEKPRSNDQETLKLFEGKL